MSSSILAQIKKLRALHPALHIINFQGAGFTTENTASLVESMKDTFNDNGIKLIISPKESLLKDTTAIVTEINGGG